MKKSAKIYAVLIALALLFTAGCGRKTADSDNVESSNELPSFISETVTTVNDEVSTEKETGTTGENADNGYRGNTGNNGTYNATDNPTDNSCEGECDYPCHRADTCHTD